MRSAKLRTMQLATQRSLLKSQSMREFALTRDLSVTMPRDDQTFVLAQYAARPKPGWLHEITARVSGVSAESKGISVDRARRVLEMDGYAPSPPKLDGDAANIECTLAEGRGPFTVTLNPRRPDGSYAFMRCTTVLNTNFSFAQVQELNVEVPVLKFYRLDSGATLAILQIYTIAMPENALRCYMDLWYLGILEVLERLR
jgi:hypothetical protein